MRADPEIFMAFRFAVSIPDKVDVIGASSVFTDPFTGSLWIGRAHRADERTLGQIFSEVNHCEIWMFTRGVWAPGETPKEARARKIKVTWPKMRWVPFNLDAAQASAALEYVCLEDATYQAVENVTAADFPLAMTKAFSRTGT
jgi:hypothetical protein